MGPQRHRGTGQARRCSHGRHRRGDTERGASRPGGPRQPRQSRGHRAPGGSGLVPGQRPQDGHGASGLQPRREPAGDDLRELARLLGWHPRHVPGGAEVWRPDRRSPGGLQAPRLRLHPAGRRAARRLLGRHRSHHQPRADGNVRRCGLPWRHPGARGHRGGEVPETAAGGAHASLGPGAPELGRPPRELGRGRGRRCRCRGH
mmetsp:Transcript_42064/g.106981  ORF Transcript_42064/g.106981 Transcript_42064/m.106981 type:complete len:203 (-) Transcript_42064:747-1355(-)